MRLKAIQNDEESADCEEQKQAFDSDQDVKHDRWTTNMIKNRRLIRLTPLFWISFCEQSNV